MLHTLQSILPLEYFCLDLFYSYLGLPLTKPGAKWMDNYYITLDVPLELCPLDLCRPTWPLTNE